MTRKILRTVKEKYNNEKARPIKYILCNSENILKEKYNGESMRFKKAYSEPARTQEEL